MSYPAPRNNLPRFLQQGRGETLDFPLFNASGGRAAVVGPGTFSLLDADGALVIDAAVVTVTEGVATVALAAEFADAYDLPQLPWRERWVLEGVSGAPSPATYEREVHVCRVAPVATITAEDLFRMHPQWRRQLPQSRASYAEPIEDAWAELLGRLLGDQVLPNRVLNWWALAIVHKYWAAHIVCRDFATDNPGDSRWERNAEKYWARSQSELEHHLGLQKDNDEDGVADHPGVLESGEPQLFLTNLPMTNYPRRFGEPW